MTVTPVHGFHSLSHPFARQTLSMYEAKRDTADQRNNLTRFMMQGKLTESRTELMAKKAARSREGGRGGGPGRPPKRVGLSRSRIMGILTGI